MNLADELTRQTELRPEAPAVFLADGKRSFRELEALVWKAARELHRLGVRPGAVLALTFASEFALYIAILASARIGATVFSLPRGWPALLRTESAAQVRACLLVTDFEDVPPAGLDVVRIDFDALEHATTPIDRGVRAESPLAPLLILTGSGSTGRAKVFASTHRQFHQRALLAGAAIDLSDRDRLACASHLDYTTPKERYLSALCAGAAIVLVDWARFDLNESCRTTGVTVLNTTVFHLERVLAALPPDCRHALGFLRVLQVSASPVSEGLRRRAIERLSPALHVRYATNESGPISVARPDEVLNPPGTVGRPCAGVSVEVVDADGLALPPGGVGLIRVKSPAVVDRYLDDEQATQAAFRDGWFMPGDLGRFTPDGQLIHCGRADHLMIMNGINIYPAEIEHVLARHPAVRDVAAVPVRSAIHHDIPVCAVTVADACRVTEQELLAFAFERLGPRGPRAIAILEAIPRSERGKLLRSALAAELEKKLPKAANVVVWDFANASGDDEPARSRPRQPTRKFAVEFRLTASRRSLERR